MVSIKDRVIQKVKELGCEIEMTTAGDYQDCIEGKEAIEIIAPEGYVFSDGLHSKICFGWKDAWGRIKDEELEKEEE